MGLAVDVRKDDAAAPSSLESAAQDAKTLAGIRIARNAAGVDMTILDRATGKTVHRTLSVPAGAEPPAPELVVLRTVELLRASLMELEAPHPSRGDVPSGPEVRALLPPPKATERPSGTLSAAVGPAALLSAGAAAGMDVGIALDGFPRRDFPLGVRLAARIPVLASSVTGTGGYASVTDTSLRASALLRLGPCCGLISAYVGAGVSLDILSFQGVATPPYTGRTVNALAVSPVLEAGIDVRLVSPLHLQVGAAIGCDRPATRVLFGTRDVGDWGCPLASAGGALAYAWP